MYSAKAKSGRCNGPARMNDGLKMRVVEIEDVTRNAVQQGGVEDIDLLLAPEHGSLCGTGKRRDRGKRVINGFMAAGAHRAAEPIDDRAHRFALHVLGHVFGACIHDIPRQRAGDFHGNLLFGRAQNSKKTVSRGPPK